MEEGQGWNILIPEHIQEALSLTFGQPWKRTVEAKQGASINCNPEKCCLLLQDVKTIIRFTENTSV